jgi:putative hydrolase of the HAD superfamily
VPVLLFDLDNTLYPHDLGVVARVDARINEFMTIRLGLAADVVDSLRRRYWEEHGTTLRGLAAEFEIDPDDYLDFIHDLDFSDLLRTDAALRALLCRIPGRKAVFSNASRRHAAAVLGLLGIEDAFEQVFGLEDLGYVPKPVPEAYERVLSGLGVEGARCSFVEDTRANLRPAKRLGMRTIWLTHAPEADDTVDHAISKLHEIEAILCGT